MHGLVADGTLGPGFLAQRQVVQHAGPAVDVATASDVGCYRRVQADRTRRHLVAVDALCQRKKKDEEKQSSNAFSAWTPRNLRNKIVLSSSCLAP